MTEPTPDTTADPAEPVEAVDPAPEAAEETPPEPVEESSNKEAAKWRRKLRDAEAQRDRLAATVEALQRSQIDAIADSAGVRPAAVHAVAALSDMVGDDGAVDPRKVADAVKQARDTLGVQTKGAPVPGVGNVPNILPNPNRWESAFKPRTR
ncbi:hypothetical protein JDV09_21060 [Mycobacterium sp. Y57]|uniref:hypothetical protein n=1 Tax=Mycolicibacterium xanthum TaxID=2796469 RepID=UPI001C85FD41|nr:hypothetical protein [Mycolicibacterium xanthum]MBX7434567.1 hypothetical protein [Mycolicibacterium xanthum]